MNSLTIPLLFVLLCSAVFSEASCSPGDVKPRERRGIAGGYNRTTHYVTQGNLGSAIGRFSYNTLCFSVSWVPFKGCTYPPKTGGGTDPGTGTTDPSVTCGPKPDPADDMCCLCLE
ncbi:hypothetical protein JTE90_027049 [Oedothorax gibbosus]|uniref:Secreted protein n=1 Tax=Oedothorax gibbosus TaxID=931172 RepID=A0AAV6TUM5_9ARAC|nr:hypothetical protein JTE90_027049 [Oedothorax gibbosus]